MNIDSESAAVATLEPDTEQVEGLDNRPGSGWDNYPLDSVFVRTDQRTAGEVAKRIQADRYVLNPEFQRDFVWDPEKQSRLIESCVMRLPLPVFYVAEAKDGRIIVVDGLQRLTTFQRFFKDELKLELKSDGPGKKNPLHGLRFKDLPLHLQERIEDTQLILYILDSKAPEQARLDIFERVNGGVPLTRQQMRNCLYSGPATEWLKDQARSEEFKIATGGTFDWRKMRDREAVNRYCAFALNDWESYPDGDMDAFLGQTLERMNAASPSELNTLRVDFRRSMEINSRLFGRHAFRKSLVTPEGGRSPLNIALFDAASVVLAQYSEAAMDEHEEELREAIQELLYTGDFVDAIGHSTNGRRQVLARLRLMKDTVRAALKC